MSSPAPRGVSDHPAKSQMEEIWRNGGRAKQILEFLELNDYPIVEEKTIARYGQRYWTEKVSIKTSTSSDELESLIQDIESSKLGTVTKVGVTKKRYPAWDKVNGESVQVEKESLQQTLEIIPNNAPTLERASIAPIKVSIPSKIKRSKDLSLAMIIPDPQIGAHFDVDGNVTTTHDEGALDLARQLQAFAEAEYGLDFVGNLGDALDLPAFTSHRTSPGYLQSTQYSIDRWATELAAQRAISPDATIVAISGNHENRLNNMLIDKMPHLHGLSRANERNPILSVANLCKYDEIGVIGVEEYPDGEFWINNYLRIKHSVATTSGLGTTAAKALNGALVSTIYGHIHRQELLTSVVKDRSNSRLIYAGSPGCMCRLDGHVPSGQMGITPKGGQAGKKREQWQHGVFFVWYETKGQENCWIDPVLFHGSKAVYKGVEFTAQLTSNGEKLNG